MFVPWRWWYQVPSLGLWTFIALLLVVRRANRRWQAWLILVPPVLVLVLWRMLAALFSMPALAAEMFGFLVVSGVLGFTAVWLLADWLLRPSRVVASLVAVAIMLAAGAIAYQGYFGVAFSEDLFLLIPYGLSVLVLLAAIVLSAMCCGGYRPGRFVGWLALWSVVGATLTMLISAVVVAIADPNARGQFVLLLVQVLLISPIWGAIVYLVSLPFMILAFNCPFYQKRFQEALRLEDRLWPSPGRALLPQGDSPFSLEPTARPVGVENVAGRWQFYLDGLSKTVILDFKPDGSFAQAIVPNQGGPTQCPGGSWRLEGPMVRLDGYVTAGQGARESRSWWMVDTPSGLALFGGDGPDGGPRFRMLHVPQRAVPTRTSPQAS